MNLSELSDFEINKRVAAALGYLVKHEFEETFGFTKTYHEMFPNTIWAAKTDELGRQCEAWEQMCFTHQWSEAGPIIERESIAAIPVIFGSTDKQWKAEQHTKGYVVFDPNPLRAAMICFLMIKEAKQS